ncbi:MAG: Gfo/Idh/MocA family oxidoreductase [Campylobacter sp.]|nr:Gfo/Idh/MocA family oxidoreductase [Campylobacter sp.]
MKKKIGIIGLGEIGKKHLSELRRSDYFELVSVCDKDEEAKQDGRFEFFKDLDEMFTNAKPEAIIIATPTKYHKENILKALKYIKYIFVEAPCTLTLEQAREMRYIAQANGAKIVVGFSERFNPTVEALKRELIKEDEVYSINIIRGANIKDTLDIIDDMLIKDLDLVRYLTNSEISFFDTKDVKYEGLGKIIHSSLKTKNNILVNISSNSFYPQKVTHMEVVAGSGVYFADLEGFMMHKITNNGRINLRVDREKFSIRKEHELFAEVCNDGEFGNLANIDDAIKIREILK